MKKHSKIKATQKKIKYEVSRSLCRKEFQIVYARNIGTAIKIAEANPENFEPYVESNDHWDYNANECED